MNTTCFVHSGPYLESLSSRPVIPAPDLIGPPVAPTPPEIPTGKSQTPSRRVQGTKGIPGKGPMPALYMCHSMTFT